MRFRRSPILVAALVVLSAAGVLVAALANSLTSSDSREAARSGESVTLDDRSGTQPENELHAAAVATCGRGTFTLHFNAEGAAVVRKAGKVVARASVVVRDLACDSPVRTVIQTADGYPWHGDLAAVTYEASVVTCQTDAPLEIVVYPTIDARGAPTGSVLLVAHPTTKRIIASAVLLEPDPTASPGTSRLYSDPANCTRT
ncbi:MAG: hypothetical protein WKF41_09340 [Gaiellaceae bacterium]